MHEFAVCQSLLDEVTRVARAHGCDDVSEIIVSIGPLSGVEAPLLARAFEIARRGTIAEKSSLGIDVEPVVVRCLACGAASSTAPNKLVCANCGTWKVKLTSGNELLLKRVELVQANRTRDA